MRYLYYPGCSAEATGKAYDISARAVMERLGVELVELDDWNCCGATSYFSVRELDSFAIAARNLAIAQQMGDDELCVICNACYTTLAKANRYMAEDPKIFEAVNGALGAVGRSYDGNVRVRHVMDIIINDIGLEAVGSRVARRLTGLRVAPYYGCQFSRPMGAFDDVEMPTTMDRLFETTGADVITDFDAKTDCCGGMMMLTRADAGAAPLSRAAHVRQAEPRRRHRRGLPALRDQPRGVPAAGQPDVRHGLRHPGHVLHPARRPGAGRRPQAARHRQAGRVLRSGARCGTGVKAA